MGQPEPPRPRAADEALGPDGGGSARRDGPPADGVRDRALVVKGRDDWKDWVQELSDHCRLDLSDLVDAALVDYARA